MSGLEVLRKIRSDHPNIQVIVITGLGDAELLDECVRLGSFASLTKPVQIDELITTMRAAGRRAIDGPPDLKE
jgi:DNA-binding NtrC family response regulator